MHPTAQFLHVLWILQMNVLPHIELIISLCPSLTHIQLVVLFVFHIIVSNSITKLNELET